jgi:hypothetical protein
MRIEKRSAITLFVGLFVLRAALTKPPIGTTLAKCAGGPPPVTWTPSLTLDFHGPCGYAENAGIIFILTVICGIILVLYGSSHIIYLGFNKN